MSRPRVIALTNQKGGVGKTTTAINLGTALAAVGERVLIVDIDPQGNASTGLGFDASDPRGATILNVMTRAAPLAQSIKPTLIPNLFLAPSHQNLMGLETELVGLPDRMFRLRNAVLALAAEPSQHGAFRYVIVDCPPSLNILTLNALAAADSVLVPVQCEFFALQGITQLKRTIDKVRANLNPQLEIQGVVLTMSDPRNNFSREVESEVRAFFGDKVYRTSIPRNIRVAEAPSHGKPILIYDHKCAGSQAYIELASEVLSQERRRTQV